MYCLWNGEYGDHDLSFAPALDTTLRIQAEQYPTYEGCVVGDFTCLKVEYDWGRRDQRWTIKCNLCGKVMYQYHTKDWRRGKGRTIYCECRKISEMKERHDDRIVELAEEKEKMKKARLEEIERGKKEYVGKVYGCWEITDYAGNGKCFVKCAECGKQLNEKRDVAKLIDGKYAMCHHPKDYSGDGWIGKRSGHLTVIGRHGTQFVAKCDCGNTITTRPTDMFTTKRTQSCKKSGCIFASEEEQKVRKKSKEGHLFEDEVFSTLLIRGYNAEFTKRYGDYGADIVVTREDGVKVAVQCKKQISAASVRSVQEVYAGGRFYDCENFVVVSPSGFTNQAIRIAKKLGVVLVTDVLDGIEKKSDGAIRMLPTHKDWTNRDEQLYEFNGQKKTLSEWGAEYGISPNVIRLRMRKGYHLKEALTLTKTDYDNPHKRQKLTVSGFTGTKQEICDHFGILRATVDYRVKYGGMTFEEAVLAPKAQNGRPKKIDNPAALESKTELSDTTQSKTEDGSNIIPSSDGKINIF